MKKRIEVISLSPAIDPANPLQQKSSLVLRFKTDLNQFEQFELDGSQKQILEMLHIDNFSDIAGRKLDVELETKDGKQRIMSFSPVDDRQISYADFEAMKSAVFEVRGMLQKIMQPIPPTPQANMERASSQDTASVSIK